MKKVIFNYYEKQFCKEYDFPECPVEKTLVIASTGRSGSHMLGHILHESKMFGFPLEYANPRNLKKWKEILNTGNNLDTIRGIQKRRTSPNGVFSIKLHYEHIKELGCFNNVKRLFPNAYFILLNRKNTLKQAVSYAMASQTGKWISEQEALNANPTYDYNLIHESMKRILKDNAGWQYTLAANNCNYIVMDFETIQHDIPNAVKNIAGFIGIDIDKGIIPSKPSTSKQSNELNRLWEEKFVMDYKEDVLFPWKKPSLFYKIYKKTRKTFSFDRTINFVFDKTKNYAEKDRTVPVS
jgi:LPS sulfotransferase NodH